MKFRLLSVLSILSMCLLLIPSTTANAYYACESGKEDTCFGDADFSFIERKLPYQIGNYDTNGGYPEWLATAPQYYYQDSCGFENRTSESYAWFKFNSNVLAACLFLDISVDEWVAEAESRNIDEIIFSDTPVVGSIAIMEGGLHGHAAYVEEILDNGRIRVSQYDLLPGSYSESIIKPHGLKFLVRLPYCGKGCA